MSRTITLECAECGHPFEKHRNEYDRQLRKNKDRNFFCGRSCATKHRNKNFSEETKEKISKHLRSWSKRAADKAALINGKQYGHFAFYLRKARERSKKRGWEMDLTSEYLESIWNEQEGRCAFCRLPMNLYVEKHGNKMFLASLDRIDTTRGYVQGNVQFVLAPLNFAKNDFSDEDFRMFLYMISEKIYKEE